MEIEENEHQSRERSSIRIVAGKNVEQFMEPTLNCCIYRLPEFLRKLNKTAYTPRLISIGPLHYSNKELMRMESQKTRYLTSWEGHVGKPVSEEFESHILNHVQYISDHYSVTCNLPISKYVKKILRDVIFIMELFRRAKDGPFDFLLKPPIRTYMTIDLLILENQLPYSLLNQLYSKAFPFTPDGSFFHLFQNFFRYNKFFEDHVSFEKIPPEFKHFTDFLRWALIMEAQLEPQLDYGVISDLPCATKLEKSGLKFKAIKGLLNIQFAKTKKYSKLQWFEANELQIPTLEIDDFTEILLRNLMAWEMFQYPMETHICNYADLMDRLIDTREDVDLLVEKEIILNRVGDNEAIAKMFNKINLNISVSCSCYYKTAENMKAHYNNPWNHAKATLKSVYFSNLWTGTATIAATFLLVLTAIQTIFSAMQLKEKS